MRNITAAGAVMCMARCFGAGVPLSKEVCHVQCGIALVVLLPA
jgi:hypothetical protein